MRVPLGVTALVVVCAVFHAQVANAYNEETHEVINRQAANTDAFGGYLRMHLGLVNGLGQRFTGPNGETRSVIEWIGRGGIQEDAGSSLWQVLGGTARVNRHFHDPLNAWSNAGLDISYIPPFNPRFESSIYWMQMPTGTQVNQTPGTENGSWFDARDYFWQALTGSTPAKRETAWAQTFQAVGQLMHLVVDAAQPEHTRNTPHPGTRRVFSGTYEYWVSAEQGEAGSPQEAAFILQYLANRLGFDRSILSRPTGDPAAPVPVAALIDANAYRGLETGPNVTIQPTPTAPAVGIAEFTNANFFTGSTAGPMSPYPFPNFLTLRPSSQPLTSGRIRAYYTKHPDDGLAVDPALAECILDEPGIDAGAARTVMCTRDRRVWAEMARHTLPRAVGYAAGLLDYFFRGRIEGRLEPPRNGEARAPLRIVNPAATPTAPGERLTGTFELYYDAADGIRVPLGRWDNITLAPGTQTDPLPIPDPPLDAPPPAAPARYLLVFRGKLGEEPDAVAATQIDGGVWYLQLSSGMRDHGALVEYPPMVLEPGPFLSGSLTPVDPAAVFDGTAYVLTAGASRKATMEYVFTCGGDNFTPMALDTFRGEGRSLMAWYRGPAAIRGDTAVLSVSGQDETLTVEGQSYVSSFSPVTIEVVRFAAPASPEALADFTALNPPVVESVLHTVSVNDPSFVEVGPIDLRGAAFVGVRLTAVPTILAPIVPSGVGGFLDNICFHDIVPRFGLVSLRIYGGNFAQGPQATIELRIQPAP